MATDYGNTIFEGELSTSVPIVQPIDNKSGQYLAQGIKATIDNTSSILFSSDAKAARADAAKNGLFAEIAEYTSFLADAKEQGRSTDEVSRLLRVKSLEWVANNPNMTDEIYTFLNKMTTDNGIGGNIRKETPLETGNRQKIEAATKDGWDVSTPDGMAAYDRQLLLQNRLKQLETDISLATSQGRMVTAQMQNEATLTLHGIVQTGTTWVNTQIERANQLLSGVQDVKTRTAIIQQTKAQVAQQLALIGSTRSAAGNSIDTSYLTAGVENIMKVWEETANGTADLTALQTAQSVAETNAIMMLYQADPELASWIALDKASKFQDPNMIMRLDAKKVAALAGYSAPAFNEDGTPSSRKPPDIVGSTEENSPITDALKASTKIALNNKDATPEELSAQGNKLFNVIRSVVAYGGNELDAKNFMSAVDLFSDTAVGRFIETNPDTIDMGVANQAREIIQKQYEGIVLPLINDEYETITSLIYKNSTGVKTDAMGRILPNPDNAQADVEELRNVIEPVWNGPGLEFKVKDEFSNDPTLRGISKKLNADVASAVNRMVRTHAHLVGTTDYEKIYNEQYASRLFVLDDEVDSDSAKKLEELTNIPDYKGPQPERPEGMKTTPTTSIKGRTGQLLDSIGEAEGADYTTLFGYDEQPGKAFDGTDITKMSISEVQDLQKKMVRTNGVSSAVGKYQFLQTTLREAVKALGISEDEKFTPEIQDKLALWLLKQRTSYQDWLSGVGDDAKFQDQLAKIWASVPDTTGKSAYAGDGINNATSGGKALIGML